MNRILVANRGEIAVRIIKTARRMGIETIAIYSDVDQFAKHAKFADKAIHVGPSVSSESYLNIKRVIEIAKANNVDGVHPGYGFLSENSNFAKALKEAGIIFIGPSEYSIATMGSKIAAKAAVKPYGIPLIPGTDQAIKDKEAAKLIAEEIGFPILVKASAGGGGKGMRIVEKAEDFEEQLERAISEAKSSFGDGSVFMEKYIASPRHIEFQILADNYGNVVHLFERECSIQRRHQKVIEEAPSAILDEELRQKMGEAAVNVAKSCKYSGAGTVEFLLDENQNFYFLEMNTRLQVEHPVTEMITGVDLVEQQIKIARNEKLSFSQDDIKFRGHAIELRVYAEDPENDFVPNIGILHKHQVPEMAGVRVDSGYEQGDEIPIYYDPMISKLICYDISRIKAIELLKKAIDKYKIEGLLTTLSFGEFACNHEAFRSGKFDTHFIENYYFPEILNHEERARAMAMAAYKIYLDSQKNLIKPTERNRNWKTKH